MIKYVLAIALILPLCLLSQRSLFVGIVSELSTDGEGPAPEDTTDIYDLQYLSDFLITPDSTKNSAGNTSTNGDDVYQYNDVKGGYQLTDRTTRPNITHHFDTIIRYTADQNLDSNNYVRVTNKTDGHFFDNTGLTGTDPPWDVYYVLMPLQTALNERFMTGGWIIEDAGNSYYTFRANNSGTEYNMQSQGGNWIMPFNKVCVVHFLYQDNNYLKVRIDTGGGFQNYGDSVNVGSISASNLQYFGMGSNTRPNTHRFYVQCGKINGTYTTGQRATIEGIINEQFNVGAYPYGGRVDNASWSFETSTNVFTMEWDHATRSGGTIDSVNIKLHHEDEGASGGIWVDRLMEVLDTTNTSANFGGASSGSFSFDRDDYAGLSAGTADEYIKAWLRVYDSNVGWSDWFESTFIINSVP